MNISIASEAKQRQMASAIIGSEIVAERGAFTVTVDKVEEIREVPFVYFHNFIARVSDVIQQHERQASLIK